MPLRFDRYPMRAHSGPFARQGWPCGAPPAVNHRLSVDAKLYCCRAGMPWRNLPERFGDFRVIHLHHSRQSRSDPFECPAARVPGHGSGCGQ